MVERYRSTDMSTSGRPENETETLVKVPSHLGRRTVLTMTQ